MTLHHSPKSTYRHLIKSFTARTAVAKDFPYSAKGFQSYLDMYGVLYFPAKEIMRPNRRSLAMELGYANFLTPHNWWERQVALALLADELRELVGAPIHGRNWWRPTDYNERVGGATSSDHIRATAVDLDFQSSDQRRAAEARLKVLDESHPEWEMSLGLGGKTIHVGLLSQKGGRSWKYASYKP